MLQLQTPATRTSARRIIRAKDAVVQQERLLFLEAAGLAGFRPTARFEPTLVARWSFIDRPDPSVLSPVSWLTRRPGVAGPEIAIYVRSTELEAQDIIVKRSPGRAE